MYSINVTIKGITGLLQHRFPMETEKVINKKTGSPDYSKEAEGSLYRTLENVIYQPSVHIERALASAAKIMKIPGKRGASYSKLVSSAVSIFPDAIPHKIQLWEIDARPVVIQKARVVRYRPLLPDWELSFEINVSDDEIPWEIIKIALEHAGNYIGIGDYRPSTGGKFGKFTVIEFKLNK
jgi:hypothetical protein